MMNSNLAYVIQYVTLLAESIENGRVAFELKYSSRNIEDKIFIISKLVLLHPQHFNKLLKIQQSKSTLESKLLKIQGPRNFEKTSLNSECQSKEIWGYDCPFKHEPKVLDHNFPYSMGGPTHPAYNKRILCRWHNMIKSNDIHNFNFEGLFIEYQMHTQNERKHWLDIQLEKITKEFNL